MPTYDYECERGHRREITRRMGERNEPLTCPECDTPMALQISAPAFTNRTRDLFDQAKDSYWSPHIMNGDIDRLRAMRHAELHPDKGQKGKTVVRVKDLKDETAPAGN